MNKRDQELLDKQLWGISPRPPQSGRIIIGFIAMFLVGMATADILSKTKQANPDLNTNYAAVISFPNGQE